VARLVLDVGGGTSEGVVISMGAAAVSESRRVAGDEATLAIIRYLKQKHQLAVGENMAEHIKMTLGSARPLTEEKTFQCRGKEVLTGIPKVVDLTGEDLREALADITREFIDLVKLLLSQAPPEFAADLTRDGLHLTGGGSLLAGLSHHLAQETGLKVHSPEEPLLSVVLGLGDILENLSQFKAIFAN
jgi:rod shape-determining protein MreB